MLLNSLYGRLFQGVVLPALLLPTRSKSSAYARHMRRMQRWPVERICEYQLEHLARLFALAGRESAFYRKQWLEAHVSAAELNELDDIRKFPITSKENWRQTFQTVWPLRRAERPIGNT